MERSRVLIQRLAIPLLLFCVGCSSDAHEDDHREIKRHLNSAASSTKIDQLVEAQASTIERLNDMQDLLLRIQQELSLLRTQLEREGPESPSLAEPDDPRGAFVGPPVPLLTPSELPPADRTRLAGILDNPGLHSLVIDNVSELGVVFAEKPVSWSAELEAGVNEYATLQLELRNLREVVLFDMVDSGDARLFHDHSLAIESAEAKPGQSVAQLPGAQAAWCWIVYPTARFDTKFSEYAAGPLAAQEQLADTVFKPSQMSVSVLWSPVSR